MTRIAAEVLYQDNLLIPAGLYTADIPDDGKERYAFLQYNGHDSPLLGGVAPNGEVTVYNCDLREGGWAGGDPLLVDLTCQTLGKQTSTNGPVQLFDGGFYVIRAGAYAPDLEYRELALSGGPFDTDWIHGRNFHLYPNAPGVLFDNGTSGSPANHAQWEGAIREAFVSFEPPAYARDQLNGDGCRPVLGMFGLDESGQPVPFIGANWPGATSAGRYRSAGGWGTQVYGSDEHFGRPAGVYNSPYYPFDYYHFTVHQMIGYAAMGSVAAAHFVRASFESVFISWKHQKLAAARAYRIFGDIGDAVDVFSAMGGAWAEYADHLLKVYLPVVLDKLDSESDRLTEVHEVLAYEAAIADGKNPDTLTAAERKHYEEKTKPEWFWNCGERGDSDHYKNTQCPWMSGQLGIGEIRLLRTMCRLGMDSTALYGRLHKQTQKTVDIVLNQAFGADPNGRMWPEDIGPFGDLRPSSQHALTGKYRQYILPFLEVMRYWLIAESRRAPNARAKQAMEKAAVKAETAANWLAAWLVSNGWYGSSSAEKNGWWSFISDEGWLTAGRLGETTEEGWKSKLGVV